VAENNTELQVLKMKSKKKSQKKIILTQAPALIALCNTRSKKKGGE